MEYQLQKMKFGPLVLLLFLTSVLHAQATSTASRSASIQLGVAGSSFSADYYNGREGGFTIYGDADLSRHLGLEALFRDASIVTPHDLGVNNLFIGPRFHTTYGRIVPYGKLLLGMGTTNFQKGYNKVAYSNSYFAYAFGAGVDLRATRHVNIRLIDFEYQLWPGFPPHGLTPSGVSAGAAYRF